MHGRSGCRKRASLARQKEKTEYGTWLRVPPPGQRSRAKDGWKARWAGSGQSSSWGQPMNGNEERKEMGKNTIEREVSGDFEGTPMSPKGTVRTIGRTNPVRNNQTRKEVTNEEG